MSRAPPSYNMIATAFPYPPRVRSDVNRGGGVAVTTLAHERNSRGASGMGGEGGSMIGSNDLERPAGKRSRGGGDMAGMAMAFGGGGSMIAGLPALVGRADDKVLRDKVVDRQSVV